MFQHTAARRRLQTNDETGNGNRVSTHSRPKAAALQYARRNRRGNVSTHSRPKAADGARLGSSSSIKFQHTAARRRLVTTCTFNAFDVRVSTHSRPKAAGRRFSSSGRLFPFQHTAARRRLDIRRFLPMCLHGFNTQPPEGGWFRPVITKLNMSVSTHSRPKAAVVICSFDIAKTLFQHTAARRRLGINKTTNIRLFGFNTQPPEGG